MKTKQTEELTLVIPDQLKPAVESSKIEHSKAEQHAVAFAPSMQEYYTYSEIIKGLNKIEPTETDAKKAREARLKLVKVRTGAEEIKDLRKEGIKAEGDLIQALYNVVKNSCIVTETEFLEIEKHQERKEKERQDKLAEERAALLTPYDVDLTYLPLGTMVQESFDKLLENSKLLHATKKEAEEKARLAQIESERKAEEERIAREKADAEAREAQRVENERLKAEAEAREKELAKEREAAEKLRKENEAKLAKERAEWDAKLAAERAETAKKIAAELAEREKIEAELKAKRDAEAKIEAEKQAALAAPDKEKINALYKAVKEFDIPEFNTTEAQQIGKTVRAGLNAILAEIKELSKTLK